MTNEILTDIFLIQLRQLELHKQYPAATKDQSSRDFYSSTLESARKIMESFSPQDRNYETMQELVQSFA